MKKFVIELPFLNYNKLDLFQYQTSIKAWVPNQLYLKKGIDTSKIKFFDYPIDNNEDILINIVKYFKFDLPKGSCKFTKVLKGGEMPFHTDVYRNCILMIPISKDPSEIIWKNKKNDILYIHKYVCPTIINGKIMHGVPNTINDRIFLQINIPLFWNELSSNINLYFKEKI